MKDALFIFQYHKIKLQWYILWLQYPGCSATIVAAGLFCVVNITHIGPPVLLLVQGSVKGIVVFPRVVIGVINRVEAVL